MMCMRCLKIQPVGPVCRTPSCGEFLMAKYYCNICKFFDDERYNLVRTFHSPCFHFSAFYLDGMLTSLVGKSGLDPNI